MKTDSGKVVSKTGHIAQAPGGLLRDDADWERLRHGLDRHEGKLVSRFTQAPPMFYTAQGHSLWLGDHYRGRSCFLIAGGPSFAELDHSLLNLPGVMTMGINNSPKTYRPNLWACVDSPSNFIRSIWLDPKITKFAPICHTHKKILNNDSNPQRLPDEKAWEWMDLNVRHCPNVVYYRRNEHFKADQFLYEDTINWGCHKDYGGGRSILFASLRILFLLGFRRVYLLGVDLNMSETQHYHFDQHRHGSSVAGNQSTYNHIKRRMSELKPYFDAEGFQVFNCSPISRLKAFPFVPYDEAIQQILTEDFYSIDVESERTDGLYDREHLIKQAKKKHEKSKKQTEQDKARQSEAAEYAKTVTDEERADAKERIDQARSLLNKSKEILLMVEEQAEKSDDQIKWHKVDVYKQWVENLRNQFRMIEDEKRIKHGEPIKWGLWKPEVGPVPVVDMSPEGPSAE